MAPPDPRLLQLTTVLTEAGLDWLALELLQGVRDGLLPEESVDDLERGQSAARSGKVLEHAEDLRAPAVADPQDFHGEAQLDWARDYVLARLSDASEMVATSLEQLNAIALPERSFTAGVNPRTGLAVELQIGEGGEVVNIIDMDRVHADLAILRDALNVWIGKRGR